MMGRTQIGVGATVFDETAEHYIDGGNNGKHKDITADSIIVAGQYISTQYTTTTTLDWNNGNVQYIQLANGGNTFTFSNPQAGGRYLLILKQPATGAAGTVTWPTITWQGGAPPTLTATNSQVDLIAFVYGGNPTVYYGTASLNY